MKSSKMTPKQTSAKFNKLLAAYSTPEKAVRWLYNEAINGNVTATRMILKILIEE